MELQTAFQNEDALLNRCIRAGLCSWGGTDLDAKQGHNEDSGAIHRLQTGVGSDHGNYGCIGFLDEWLTCRWGVFRAAPRLLKYNWSRRRWGLLAAALALMVAVKNSLSCCRNSRSPPSGPASRRSLVGKGEEARSSRKPPRRRHRGSFGGPTIYLPRKFFNGIRAGMKRNGNVRGEVSQALIVLSTCAHGSRGKKGF